MDILNIFLDPKHHKRLGTKDPRVLYWRTNADLASINDTEYILQKTANLQHIIKNSNLAILVNEVDDQFFEAIQKWSNALQKFVNDALMDESFFK